MARWLRAQAPRQPPFRRNVVLVSEHSAADMSFALIAGERARASEAERERLLKRAGAGIAVVLVHIIILLALFTAGQIAALRHRAQPQEEAPKFTITVPTPKTPETQKPGDVMQAIGKELACGAGPWEHLSQAER